MQIVLASASPRRRALLTQLGLSCTVVPSGAEEISHGEPAVLVQENALRKVRDVQPRYPSAVILGADTVVVCRGEILGKPADREQASQMLRKLSSQWHIVTSGVAVTAATVTHTFSVDTKVKFRELSSQDIQQYVESGEPLDKAGAYGIQGLGGMFVEQIKGCYYNVVGLPLPRLVTELERQFGFSVWELRT